VCIRNIGPYEATSGPILRLASYLSDKRRIVPLVMGNELRIE